LTIRADGFKRQVEAAFQGFEYDVVGISAGFDTYVEDWGGLLSMEDYREIGKIIREGSERCKCMWFAVLKGGYHYNLRLCVKSFLEKLGELSWHL
jgi:acetoin utilization deacetylase AcuC-like enzyme